jgi:hypothetical protein
MPHQQGGKSCRASAATKPFKLPPLISHGCTASSCLATACGRRPLRTGAHCARQLLINIALENTGVATGGYKSLRRHPYQVGAIHVHSHHLPAAEFMNTICLDERNASSLRPSSIIYDPLCRPKRNVTKASPTSEKRVDGVAAAGSSESVWHL